MRIGVDARSALAARPRGEGKTLVRLYREIRTLRPHWEIVFYGEGDAPSSGLEHIRERTFDLPGFRYNTWENLGLPFYARLDRVDVLHCAGSSAPRYCAGIPTVMTVHDVIPLLCDDGWPEARIRRFRRQIRYGVAAAETVIAVSETTKQDLLRLFDVAPAKVQVVHWGSDPIADDCTYADDTGELSRLGIDGPYLMAFGGGAARKNTERVIRAFGTAVGNGADVDLVIVGAGEPSVRRRFLALAAEAGAGTRVKVLVYVSDAALTTLYGRALGLVYASLYEGFGLPVLEAMSRKVPVIASNRSSIPEVTGDAALLVDPEDKDELAKCISRLAADADLRERLAGLGRRRAGRFSWRDTAERTIQIMEELAWRTAQGRRGSASLTS